MIPVYKLQVYQLAEKLSDLIWSLYDTWPDKVKFAIGYQIFRSVDSISVNIADGYGRFTSADRKTFYRYTRGSFEETKTWLRKLKRRTIIHEKDFDQLIEIINELGPKLNAFINKTK
ncbi:MAG: four helix bundle protein [Fidelibacterota bacterium]